MAELKTIIITGAAHGIGQAIAHLFCEKGWNVIGTSRQSLSPSRSSSRITYYPLDLTNPLSIDTFVQRVVADFGGIDVLVNNAGVCLLGPHEELNPEEDHLIFETNVLGPMRLMRGVLPLMRERGGGRIISISSICGGMTLPLYSQYCATKWAIEGFCEALAFEVRQHNILIKIIQPAVFKTGSFENQLAEYNRRPKHPAYRDFISRVLPNIAAQEKKAPTPEVVAETVWRAANDRSPRLRYRPRSHFILAARTLIPTVLYHRFIRRLLNAW